MSRRFTEKLVEFTNGCDDGEDIVVFGMAQDGVPDDILPFVMGINLAELCVGGIFDANIWEDMIDDAFENDVKRPWFLALGVPVTSVAGIEYHHHMPYFVMERMLVRYMYFSMNKHDDELSKISGDPEPLSSPLLVSILDEFLEPMRKHVVHQG